MNRKRIGWDLDGVCYDFGNSFRDYMCHIGREFDWEDGQVENTIWNFYESLGMSLEEFKSVCDAGVDSGHIFSGGVRPNAVESIGRIASLGHEIIIITDRQFGSSPDASHRATEEWLSFHEIEYDELWFSADKTCTWTDYFVEDKLENYDALTKAGTNCFLITRPWNIDPVNGVNDDRQRICDIVEYAWAVDAMTFGMPHSMLKL